MYMYHRFQNFYEIFDRIFTDFLGNKGSLKRRTRSLLSVHCSRQDSKAANYHNLQSEDFGGSHLVEGEPDASLIS